MNLLTFSLLVYVANATLFLGGMLQGKMGFMVFFAVFFLSSTSLCWTLFNEE